ncbi:MAG: glycosyltransferase family 2 protein [Vicinamibacterales bacterium]
MTVPTIDATGVAVIIPALNEEQALPHVLDALPCPTRIVTVVDNGSTDRTAAIAAERGARVVAEPRRGYGRACLAGIAANRDADVLVFLDADFSDHPEVLPLVLGPVQARTADLVMGVRHGEGRPWHANLGTSVCLAAINLVWGTRYRDLGPFRAIRREALDSLAMEDETWGWTIEMQVKAAEAGLRTLEIDVPYRDRIGQSKISGTVSGTVRAGSRMLLMIGRLAATRGRRRYPDLSGASARAAQVRTGRDPATRS